MVTRIIWTETPTQNGVLSEPNDSGSTSIISSVLDNTNIGDGLFYAESSTILSNVVRGLKLKSIGDDVYDAAADYLDFWIATWIVILGLITNILNIVIFSRQGFKDGVSISMTCIAIWDFLKCLAGFVVKFYVPFRLISLSFSVNYENMVRIIMSYTHLFSGQVSNVLATYVSIERCLCVCIPFTVKSIFTPRFTLIMVITISVVVFGAFFVVYCIFEIVFVYCKEYNTTIARYHYNSLYYKHGEVILVYYQTLAIVLPFASFTILCMCSAITVLQLRKSSQSVNEKGTTHATEVNSKGSGISQRERQVVKMLLIVICVYIGNLFPRIVFYIAQLSAPGLYINKQYDKLTRFIAIPLFILDDLNAVVNFFIFLKMSSKFRETFVELFPSSKRWL